MDTLFSFASIKNRIPGKHCWPGKGLSSCGIAPVFWGQYCLCCVAIEWCPVGMTQTLRSEQLHASSRETLTRSGVSLPALVMLFSFQPSSTCSTCEHFICTELWLFIGTKAKHVPWQQDKAKVWNPSLAGTSRKTRNRTGKSLSQLLVAVNKDNYSYRALSPKELRHFIDAAPLILITRV